jgi:hypothetical protein
MRQLFALAVVLAGCGSAAPHAVVRPAAVDVSPSLAAAAARAVIDVKYGVDPVGTSDHKILGRAEWLNDAAWLAAKWERGIIVQPIGMMAWFRVVAVVENPRPGEVAVRIVGLTSGLAQRFDGLEGVIQSGDPRMPAWADDRVARLQLAVNHVLRQYAVH